MIAHRGGASIGAENAVATMQLAGSLGADAVEVDVHELADGSIVLAHDAYVIEGETWRWLRGPHLRPVPRLVPGAETLDGLIDGIGPSGLGLYLEVKSVTRPGLHLLIEKLIDRGMAEKTMIGSFRGDVVIQVADDGRLPSSLLYPDRSADPVALAASCSARSSTPASTTTPR